jgi:acetyl-CoA carboxylase, biotin carboxylase subunit
MSGVPARAGQSGTNELQAATETMFSKVLIANRGEIAVRVIRALKEMDIASVAVFSEADRKARHVFMADEAIPIGPAPSAESYLAGEKILRAARETGAQAIHPGYGFLSENAAFARACAESGIKFIGPAWESIERMGSKTAARRLAIAAGAPVVPGTEQGITNISAAKQIALEIGYPVLLKAAAGGGGKGMRRVDSEQDLAAAMRAAQSEAERAFGSGEIYLEKFIERPRHIEVQVLGDEHGHLIHLGERECSIQRRHQKVIEESPSPLVIERPGLRDELGAAALMIARAAGYYNAGTIEFLADQQGRFYFLEMNTRLQVEHPVTEMVTGVDLVKWQLRIAAGERLDLKQEDIAWRGSAIECRVYAEDPDNDFLPSPGPITQYAEPGGPGVRVDGGVYEGWIVPVDYDPLLAKLVVWAETREAAVDRMRRAVSEYHVSGITTNLGLFARVMRNAAFRAGKLDTGFLDRLPPEEVEQQPGGAELVAAILAGAAHHQNVAPRPAERAKSPLSRWRMTGQGRLQQ